MKNKVFTTIILLCIGVTSVAQVGIGTDDPKATLHVNGDITTNVDYVHPDCENNGWKCISSYVFTSSHYYGANETGNIFIGERGNELHIRGKLEIGYGNEQHNSEYKLDVNGNINTTGEIFYNGDSQSSDQRWKKEIKTLDNSLDKITALRGVSYDWKRNEFPDKNFSEGTQIGVIAQEIETVFPELVHTDKEGYKSVSYSNLVAPLIEAVKELKLEVETLQKEIEKIKKQ